MNNKETLANLFQSIAGPFKYPCQTSFKTGTVKFDFTSEGKRSWKQFGEIFSESSSSKHQPGYIELCSQCFWSFDKNNATEF